MNKLFSIFMIGLAFFSLSLMRYDETTESEVSKNQLKAFVKEAVAFAKIYGKKEALREFNNKEGLFVRGELYIYAYDFKCRVLAHGQSPHLQGKIFNQLKDKDGVKIIPEMIKIIKRNGKGWLHYRWFHPINKKIMNKIGYFEKIGKRWWIGSGIYIYE